MRDAIRWGADAVLVSLAGLVLLAAPLWAPILEKCYEWYDSATADD